MSPKSSQSFSIFKTWEHQNKYICFEDNHNLVSNEGSLYLPKHVIITGFCLTWRTGLISNFEITHELQTLLSKHCEKND